MTMRRTILICVFIGLISSCHRDESDSARKTVFRYNESSGISSLDPAFSSDQARIWACNHLFNGLVQLDQHLIPRPCIAKRWEISEEGLVYTFHLRTDVKFHNSPFLKPGRKVTAGDFVYSFNRITDEKTTSPGSWIFQCIRRDSSGNVNGFEATNDSTLRISLRYTFPPLLGLLASTYASVVPHEVVQHFGKDFRRNPVGTGPFIFHSWHERTALVLHKNPEYFETDAEGKKLPYLDAVMISFINDKQTAFLEFIKGKLDFISGLDASYKDDLLTTSGKLKEKYQKRFRMETGPYLNTEYLGIVADTNLAVMKGNPLSDIRIRQAINYGFDRKRMIRYLRNGMATPGTGGMIPPGIPGFDNIRVHGYDYQPGKALELLKAAGYPNGRGLPPITMSTTHAYQDLCEYMQGQLSEIGIQINLEINQAAQHRQMVAKQQLGFFRGSWIGDYADGENYLALFSSENKAPKGPNYTHLSNPLFDDYYQKAMQENNDTLRHQYYAAMDSLVMSASPVIVLYYDKVMRLSHFNVEGLEMNAMNLLQLKKVRITAK
jgi:peptide/nickel transport system substrate-binding protein